MPKPVEESLLGDHSDHWMDSDCPEPKRLKVSSVNLHKSVRVRIYGSQQHLSRYSSLQ